MLTYYYNSKIFCEQPNENMVNPDEGGNVLSRHTSLLMGNSLAKGVHS